MGVIMTEPHETFTWYDTDTVKIKLSKKNQSGLANGQKKIVVQKGQIIIEDYPTKRNKRIAIRRALYTLGFLIAVWGLVWITL